MTNNATGAVCIEGFESIGGIERVILSPEQINRGIVVLENFAKRIDECNKNGHEETFVAGYDLNHWTAQCYCEKCGNFYDRGFTQEESERFRKELNEPVTI